MSSKRKIMIGKDLKEKAKEGKKMETRRNRNTLRRNSWPNLMFLSMETTLKMKLKV